MFYYRSTYRVALLVALAAVLCSCNSFERLLKNPDYALKYSEAVRYYNAEKYDKAAALYENVQPFYRNTAQDDTIGIRIARCYFFAGDLEMSKYYFEYFQKSFPRSPFVREADLSVALCDYYGSARAELDQAQTVQAIQSLNFYLYKYPEGENVQDCKDKLSEMEQKLAHKSYLSARLYYHTEHYKAAVVALKNSLKQHPDSRYREELLFLIVKSSYLHAENSVEDKQQERFQATVDEYLNLVSEYPDSQYKKEAEKMYKNIMKKTETSADAKSLELTTKE